MFMSPQAGEGQIELVAELASNFCIAAKEDSIPPVVHHGWRCQDQLAPRAALYAQQVVRVREPTDKL